MWVTSSGCIWKHSQLGGWLPGGWGTVEGAGAAPQGPGFVIWTVGLGRRESKARDGLPGRESGSREEQLLGGAECGSQCCPHQPRRPFWLTQVLPAGLDALGQVLASPPSPKAVPAHWVGAELPPFICTRRLATTRQAEGSLASHFFKPCPALPTRRSEPSLEAPDGPTAALQVAPLGQSWGWPEAGTYLQAPLSLRKVLPLG